MEKLTWIFLVAISTAALGERDKTPSADFRLRAIFPPNNVEAARAFNQRGDASPGLPDFAVIGQERNSHMPEAIQIAHVNIHNFAALAKDQKSLTANQLEILSTYNPTLAEAYWKVALSHWTPDPRQLGVLELYFPKIYAEYAEANPGLQLESIAPRDLRLGNWNRHETLVTDPRFEREESVTGEAPPIRKEKCGLVGRTLADFGRKAASIFW